jgi:hypothetical protein
MIPCRTQDNVIDGVVITFTDITEIKQLEAELRDRGGREESWRRNPQE